jgi:hypothetical protein
VRTILAALIVVSVVAAQPFRRADPHPVKVSVVVIAASTTSKDIDSKLEGFAAAMQKTNPEFTGFKVIGGQDSRVKVGEKGTFPLDGTDELTVKVDKAYDPKDGTIGLTVFPPGAGEIAYSCTSGKYVPLVTDAVTKAGDKILVAVMAKPAETKRKK